MRSEIDNSSIIFDVKNKGWVKIDKFFDDDILNDFVKKFDVIFEECRNPNYDNVSEIKFANMANYPEIKQIYSTITNRIDLFKETNLNLEKIWIVKSESSTIKQNELPYIPHIDKRRMIKIMVYMCEVGKSNGPLTLATVDPNKYERLRESLPKNYKDKKLNSIKDMLEYTSVLGSVGDLVIFDTNCPHYASTVEVDSYRKILRMDFLFDEKIYKHSKIKIFFNKLFFE